MLAEEYRQLGGIAEKIEKSILNGNVSHAYIIEADTALDKERFAKCMIRTIVCAENEAGESENKLLCRKVDHDNYEDLYYARSDELSVKDAVIEELQEKLRTKPVCGNRNFAIVENADTMTARAQNRFLKTLEEPPYGTVIFLLSENTENLLRTVTSRCVIYRLGNFEDSTAEERIADTEEIINMVVNDACFFDIKEWLTKHVKSRKEALIFLDSIERLFRKYMLNEAGSPFSKSEIVKNIRHVEEARLDLRANVNYKYAVRNLIIKIGG